MTGKTAIYVRMCVAVKRKLLFYYWKKGEFLELREDIVLPDVPRALAWCADSICVGFKNDYVLYQVCIVDLQVLIIFLSLILSLIFPFKNFNINGVKRASYIPLNPKACSSVFI